MIAVDTNILIHAHRSGSELHTAARDRLTRFAEGKEPWALPVFVLAEFLRVVTHRAILRPPTPTAMALGVLEALAGSPSLRVLNPVDGFLDVLADVVTEAKVDGNEIFDAQIVAVCRQHGVKAILSEDRGFRRFAGIKTVTL